MFYHVKIACYQGATKAVKEINDTGNGAIIANCDAVQAAIIYA